MEIINELERILLKSTSNISKANRKKAADYLCILFERKADLSQIVDYLIKFHYSVCQLFFEKISLSTTDDDVLKITEVFINSEQFKNDKLNKIRFSKGFASVLALAKGGKYQAAFLVLNEILAYSEKDGKFTPGSVNSFIKLIVEKKALPSVKKIFEEIAEKKIICEKSEERRLKGFLQVVDGESAKLDKPAGDTANIELFTNRIENLQKKILAFLESLDKKTQYALAKVLKYQEEEILLLHSKIKEKETEIMDLNFQLSAANKQLTEKEVKIVDLTDRLKNLFHADSVEKNQELEALKIKISEALKLDYLDFIKIQDRPFNQDLFEAYRSMLIRIYQTLKRFGITYQ